MLMWLVAVILAAAAIGVALLTLGLRGRRINDHPHCRRCRFDLHGVDIEGDGARCPECGIALDRPKAIRIGARQRRPRFIGLGAVALLVAVAIGVASGWSAATGFNWNTVKPVWMLEIESRALDTPGAVAAAEELASRAMDGKLPEQQHLQLAERGVAAFEGGLLDGHRAWGNIIETAFERGVTSSQMLASYLESRLTIRTIPRRMLRAGDPLPISIDYLSVAGGDNRPGCVLYIELEDARIGNASIGDSMNRASRLIELHNPSSSRVQRRVPAMVRMNNAPPLGEHELEVVLKLSLACTSYTQRDEYRATEDGGSVTVWRSRITAPVLVISDEEDADFAIVDEAKREHMARAIEVEYAIARPTEEGVSLECLLSPGALPIGVSGEIVWRANGREWMIGGVAIKPGEPRNILRPFVSVVDGFDASTVDIIIRPNPAYARRWVDLVEFWGEEIVIRDVPVTREE